MKNKKAMLYLAIFLIALIALGVLITLKRPNIDIINSDGYTISTRFNPPEGFVRVVPPKGSFGEFLQNLPLLEDKALVHYYDGRINFGAKHDAVLAYTLPPQDIEQCADVVMHLRAEYLYTSGRQDEIGFHFVSGFYCDFATWAQGFRPSINGNDVTWVKSAEPDASYNSFQNYLKVVYTYASTISLDKELVSVPASELSIGDVFIIPGSPGHVVIVADMAINPETGEKRFIIVQGNMPSEQAHVVKNPEDPLNSPWYSNSFPNGVLKAPNGWECSINNIKRFPS